MTSMFTLQEIREKIEELAGLIDAPTVLLPDCGESRHDCLPYIEAEGGVFSYVVTENGEETRRDTTDDLSQLLFWVFDSVTFAMAVKYERKNREPGQDFRRVLFARQEELLGMLDPEWRRVKQEEHGRMPFDDFMDARLDYYKQMLKEARRSGGGEASDEELWARACEKYPEP